MRTGNLIGLVGRAGAGKDTFARALTDIGVDCGRFAFADAVKQEISAVLGVSLRRIEEEKTRFRAFAQWWGTEWRREGWGQDYWVSQLAPQIDAFPAHRLAVITDVRFPNEAEFVTARGGKLIRITRDEDVSLVHSALGHISEQSLNGYATDFTVHNPGRGYGKFLPLVAEIARAEGYPRR